jgi:uncharacterized protein (DUF302 family)
MHIYGLGGEQVAPSAALCLYTILVLLPSCSTAPPSHTKVNSATSGTVETPFLIARVSQFDVAGSIDRVVSYIESELPPVNVEITVDHQAAAAAAGLQLDPTTVVVFGNPSLGTDFMVSNQEIGLDLPLKILAWTTPGGQTLVAYNNPEYLKQRYAIADRDAEFETMRGVLQGC